MKILISGCHSGPNPSSGLGTAHSLREAFPQAVLTAKDHSVCASGIHDLVFDSVWLCRPWDELDLECHLQQIREHLEAGYLVLPGLDLEVRWLAANRLTGVVVPPVPALIRTAKPAILAASALPVKVPPSLGLGATMRDLQAFCRAHDWRVWIKGSTHEARRAGNWRDFERFRRELEATWGAGGLFVQADVRGLEVCIAFAAFEGRLLDAVFLEKRSSTETGKTWAGVVRPLSQSLRDALAALMADLGWSGGGELEFVREEDGTLWLIDWNPRFPAWIHGATLAGHNLPAALVAAATGMAVSPPIVKSPEFIRIVTEIPTRSGFPLPLAVPATTASLSAGSKHPSGMPLLNGRLASAKSTSIPAQVSLSGEMVKELTMICHQPRPTPFRAILPVTAEQRFGSFAARVRNLESPGTAVHLAYSLKTNPDTVLLHLAHNNGMLVDVIGQRERLAAIEAGFHTQEIIYNGPIPATWPAISSADHRVAFADSLNAFRRYVERPPAPAIGFRVRPLRVTSRFGVDVSDITEFQEAVALLRQVRVGQRLAISMHIQSSHVGRDAWISVARSVLEFAAAMRELSGQSFQILDFGGGWHPDDFEFALTQQLPALFAEARSRFPEVREMIIEPGKALAEPCGVVVAHIVEIRSSRRGTREVIVDASIAEVPLILAMPHRIVAMSDERHEVLASGQDRVLGRLCMEDDILAIDVRLPSWLVEGDLLCICDTGAYDTSMAYQFGLGSSTTVH